MMPGMMCSSLRSAAEFRHPAFHRRVVFLRVLDRGCSREHHIGGRRRHVLALLGGAGLHDHRIALRRARNVDRSAHREMLALVVEYVNFCRIEEDARRLVAHEGVVLPAVPQPAHHLDEFRGAAIALVIVGRRVVVEILCLHRRYRGDDVPAGTAAAQMVERGELPRDVKRLAVGGRERGDKADALCRHRQGGEQRDRLKARGVGKPAERARRFVVLANSDRVGKEDHVELSSLGGLRDLDGVLDVRAAIGRNIGCRHAAT